MGFAGGTRCPGCRGARFAMGESIVDALLIRAMVCWLISD
jgi:hypothetical protein